MMTVIIVIAYIGWTIWISLITIAHITFISSLLKRVRELEAISTKYNTLPTIETGADPENIHVIDANRS